MSKKHFIALADCLRLPGMIRASIAQALALALPDVDVSFAVESVMSALTRDLADFCGEQNSRFNRERFIDYVQGMCGPNGGKR
jgi:hypothetical protein